MEGRGMRLKLAVVIALIACACGSVGPGGGGIGSPLTLNQLKFKVIDAVGVPIFCDPDFYPIGRAGGEEASADTYYPQIRSDPELYAAIVAHEHMPSGDLNESQKLTLYRAFKHLRALVLTKNGDTYTFEMRVKGQGASAVDLVDGSVRVDGVVMITTRNPSAMPPCPICLASATLIATPSGEVRVTDVRPGMLVWSIRANGERVARARRRLTAKRFLGIDNRWLPTKSASISNGSRTLECRCSSSSAASSSASRR